ncbi:hypothetical protein PIB30_101290 [Stylosanthes scabra]|uniref:Uncharacterized protein n=1 Tax=Stylosanthes scabra TaxID=79078 RepID=A0ABU6X0H8_9FABA|nr:hypothetical protein [Stylosanthes scabra]
MASEAFTRSILFSNASRWCFGSVVPSYGLISTGYRNFLGISSARMRGEKGCLPFSLPGARVTTVDAFHVRSWDSAVLLLWFRVTGACDSYSSVQASPQTAPMLRMGP